MNKDDLIIKKLQKTEIEACKKDIMDLRKKIVEVLFKDEYFITTDWDEILSFLEEEGIFLGIFQEERLVAVSWAGKNEKHLQEVKDRGVNIPGTKVLVHDSVFVDPDFRGKGLQYTLMKKTVVEAKKMGYDSTWCQAHPENRASVTSIEKAGYQKIGTIIVANGWVRDIFYRKL